MRRLYDPTSKAAFAAGVILVASAIALHFLRAVS